MKNNKFSAFLVALLTFSFATVSFAQYDDLYFDPATDTEAPVSYEVEDESTYEVADATEANEYDEYEYYDDQEYHYSSRIRRFNRPTSRFNYYDPYYTDASYYNSAYSPGVSIYVGNPFSYNNYRRSVRANAFYNPFRNNYNPYFIGRNAGFNSPFGFGGYGNSFGRSSYGYGGGGGSYNAYCPPTSYGTSRAPRGANNTTFGPRGSSTSVTRSNDTSVRRGTTRGTTQSVRGNTGTARSRTSGARNNNSTTRTNRTYQRSNSSNRRTYAPSRSNRSSNRATRSNSSSRRSSATQSRRSSSRSYSSPSRNSSRSSSTRSSSRRNNL